MRVQVDLARCTGTANCVVAAPDVFEIGDDDEQVRVIMAEVAPGRMPAIENAVRMCPQGALSLDELADG
jgi:ferredoxin